MPEMISLPLADLHTLLAIAHQAGQADASVDAHNATQTNWIGPLARADECLRHLNTEQLHVAYDYALHTDWLAATTLPNTLRLAFSFDALENLP